MICFEYTCRDLEYRFAEPGKKHVPGTFSPKARKAIVGLVRHIHDEAQRRGWPKLYFFPDRRARQQQDARTATNSPRTSWTSSTKSPAAKRPSPSRPIACSASATAWTCGSTPTATTIATRSCRRQGRAIRSGTTRTGCSMHTARSPRASLTGFEFLRSGAEVATAWGFAATNANPYNDFDGGHKDWNVIFPGVDGPTPTIYWELCREGVDDCRYVATLQQQIRASQAAQARRARRNGPRRCWSRCSQLDAPPIDNPLAFGRYRWRIAREILALQGDRELALPFAAVADNPPRPDKIGPNLVENPSFEAPPQADGSAQRPLPHRLSDGEGKAGRGPESDRRGRPFGPLLAEVGPQQSGRRRSRGQGPSLAHRQRGLFERHGEKPARQAGQSRILDAAWRRHDGAGHGPAPEPQARAGRRLLLQGRRRGPRRLEPL